MKTESEKQKRSIPSFRRKGFMFAIASWTLMITCGSVNGTTSLDRESRVFETIEWSLENPDWRGNPFDLEATATFTHRETDRVITTPLFYDGEDTWCFRFTAPRPGTWAFATVSPHMALHGHEGLVEVTPDAEALGFLTTDGSKFARQVGDERNLQGTFFHVLRHDCLSGYHDPCPDPFEMFIADWEAYPEGAEALARRYARDARAHGMNAIHFLLANQVFAPRVWSYLEHDKENPDLGSFRILEQIIRGMHREGVVLHMWMWGDEQRKWTPMGLPGGINGKVDRRLQRYIAARLGPLPGWTMGYGFDLFETDWTGAKPELVRDWHKYLNAHWGWEHLLMAREEDRKDFKAWFATPEELPVYSTDDHRMQYQMESEWEFYRTAKARLEGVPFLTQRVDRVPDQRLPVRPVLFERRFLHTRDGVWDKKTTVRAMWQFTLAGGAGAIWGRLWGQESPPYSPATRERMLTYERFWKSRWTLDLKPAPEVSCGENSVAMTNEDASRVIAYGQDADRIRLINLNPAFESYSVIAVDTKQGYKEMKQKSLKKGDHEILLPHRSNWAIALEAEKGASQTHKPRIIVTTDGELDDQNGFIRLLLYANEFDFEGLIYSSSQWHYSGDGEGTLFSSQMPNTAEYYGERSELRWTGTEWIQEFIDLYAENYQNLLKHDPGYPSPAYLKRLVRVGNIEFEGEMEAVTPGSELIKEVLLDEKPGPVQIQVWGGTNTLARALKSIEEQFKGTAEWDQIHEKVSNKAIVYIILGQDVTFQEYILPNWPDLKTIYNHGQPRGFAYDWHKRAPKAFHSLLSGDWYTKHILRDRGPLLDRYYTYGDGRPVEGDEEAQYFTMEETRRRGHEQFDFIGEWDSPAWLHAFDYRIGIRSIGDPPSFGGLGGRFVQSATNPSVWADEWTDIETVTDFNPYTEKQDPWYPQTRWIAVLQNDFAARADWLVKSYEDANHAPAVELNHPATLQARAGQEVQLSATASDPDGDAIEYHWWHYVEAGTLDEELAIEAPHNSSASLIVPANAEPGDTIHILVQATDNGYIPMSGFRRVVINIK